MRCPRCSELAVEGAAICGNCNEILDPSVFSDDDEPPPAGEKTDVGPAPQPPPASRPGVRYGSVLAQKKETRRGGWDPRAAGPGAAAPLQRPKPYLAPEPAPARPTPIEEAQRSADDLRAYFRSLRRADRWALAASAALLVSLALPWQWTRRDEEIIGLLAAWPVALLAAGTGALVYYRSRRADALLERRLRVGQLVAALVTLGTTLGFFFWANESRSLRAAGRVLAVSVSTPAFGAYLGLLFAAAALLASATALLD